MRPEVAAPLPKPIYLEVLVHFGNLPLVLLASMWCAHLPVKVTVLTPDVFG